MVDMSDTPAGMIARLDEALARRGRTVTVTRRGGAGPTVNGVKAAVRVAKEDEIAGLAQQLWWKVTLSPTGLSSVLPLRKGDTVTFDNQAHAVERPGPIVIGDVLVRIDLVVAG